MKNKSKKLRKNRKSIKDPYPALTAASKAGFSDGDLHRLFFRDICRNNGI